MKNGIVKKLLAVAMVSVIAFGAVSCGKKDTSANRLDEIKKSGKLVVGLSADYAPYEFHISKDGKDEIIGFDVEIAKELAKDLGVQLEIKDMDFDALVSAIPTKKVDIVISGMTPTDERQKAVDFTDLYYLAEQTAVVRKADAAKYTKMADLANQKVGAQMGAIQVDVAKDNIPNADVQQLSSVNDLTMQVKSSKVEAMVVEKPVAEMIVKNNPDLVMISESVKDKDGQGSAIAYMKGAKGFGDALNTTIKRLKDDGSIEKFAVAANELASQAVDKPKQ